MSREVSIIYSSDALKQLKRLPVALSKRIVTKVADNANQSNPILRAKPLVGKLSGRYRYRVGDYRVVFVLDEKGKIIVLTVLSVKHRKDIYK